MLRPEDRFSLVVYDDRIDVLVASTPASAEARRNAERMLAKIDARGSTDLGGGWSTGCEQVAAHLDPGALGRALLLTDGLANQGITDHDELVRHAEELRSRHITTSTFGVGSDFDETLLQRMATAGGGNSYFIERNVQILDYLTSELGEALEVVARDACVEVILPAPVQAEPLHERELLGRQRDLLHAPALVEGHPGDDRRMRGVPAERVVVIHPGVDSQAYRPDPATPRATRPTFLYLGRLKRYKGVELALRAIAAARQSRADITLDICGQGDDRPRLERLARELGLAAAVRFLGFVPEEEKRRLLRRAWAVVFPSPKEGWGITNVEAAACGTPALASDSDGLRESVRDGVTGYLVPHGDSAALANRMLALANDPGLVERLGLAARSFAEGLSWDAAARATVTHIEQTIAARESES